MSRASTDPADYDAVFCRVCEEVAFVLADPVPAADLAQVAGPYCVARVSIEDAVCGEVEVALPESTAQALADNLMLPTDGATGHAIARELANIVAGSLVGLITGDRALCRFSVPVEEDWSATDWQAACARPEARAYEADEGPLLWLWRLEEKRTSRVLLGGGDQLPIGEG